MVWLCSTNEQTKNKHFDYETKTETSKRKPKIEMGITG